LRFHAPPPLSCYGEKRCGELLLLLHGEQRGPKNLSLALQAIAVKIAHFPFGEWHKHALRLEFQKRRPSFFGYSGARKTQAIRCSRKKRRQLCASRSTAESTDQLPFGSP